jgi:predicted MFS family arabinose efflux permease
VSAVAAPLGAFLGDRMGFRFLFMAVGIIALISGVFPLLIYKSIKEIKEMPVKETSPSLADRKKDIF